MKIKKECLAFCVYLVLVASLTNTVYAETSEKESDLASDSIMVVRMISEDGQMHIVPYEEDTGKNELTALYVPVGDSVRRLELKGKGIGNLIDQGCFNVSKQEIVFPEITSKEGKIYLHSVQIQTGEHQKTDLNLQYKNETSFKYDCYGLLIWGRHSASKITYQKINENKQLADSWTVQPSDLIKDKKPYLLSAFIGSKGIHIVVKYKDDKGWGLISLSKEGRPNRIEAVSKELDQVLMVQETSYGYAATQKKDFWDRVGIFKLFDSDFKLLGQPKLDSLFPPRVRAMDNKSYLLFDDIKEKDGSMRLMVIASDVKGHTTGYPVNYKGEKITSFGTTEIGIVNGKLFIVAMGSRLQKTAKGYLIKPLIAYFPIEIGKP